jgi:hypothetical protein
LTALVHEARAQRGKALTVAGYDAIVRLVNCALELLE